MTAIWLVFTIILLKPNISAYDGFGYYSYLVTVFQDGDLDLYVVSGGVESEAGDEAGMLLKEMTTYYHAAISRFSRMNAPLIAAVNGLRGERSLAYEARIRLSIWCGEELRAALEKNRSYVAGETLASDITLCDLADDGGALEGSAGDQAYRVDFVLD